MYLFETSIFGIHIAPTWYGLMYAIGFSICYYFMSQYGKIRKKDMDTLLLYVFFGVIGGGRLGYVIFYNPTYFMNNPDEILALWNGGMSFHGGLVGVLIAIYTFCLKFGYPFFETTDILAVCIPIALGLGRIGNWINGELPGYAGYTGPLAMNIGNISYFPSPLFQAFLEGIVLSILLFTFWSLNLHGKLRLKSGVLSSIFLIGYASLRSIAEQFRLPDEHIGYIFGTSWITLGMIYTLPMLLGGIIILLQARSR